MLTILKALVRVAFKILVRWPTLIAAVALAGAAVYSYHCLRVDFAQVIDPVKESYATQRVRKWRAQQVQDCRQHWNPLRCPVL